MLQEHLSVIASRPEFPYNGLKLSWFKAQMEHARGATQAQQVSAATPPSWGRDGYVHMGAVLQDATSRSANAQEPSLLWHFQGESAKHAAGGDWNDVNVLNGAIMALAKGKVKGKGTATGDFRAKGASPKSAGKGGDGFDGNWPKGGDGFDGNWPKADTWMCEWLQGEGKG